jgi:hypothetical protein
VGHVPGIANPPAGIDALTIGDTRAKPCPGPLAYHLSKLSPQGHTLWTRLLGGSVDTVAADPGGGAFVLVQGGGEPVADGLAVPAGVRYSVVKVSPAGAVAWAQSLANVTEANSFLNASGMIADSTGAALVAGTFKGSVAFAKGAPTLTHLGWAEVLVRFAP